MTPIRRDFRFGLPADRVLDWHPEGRHVTAFFNTLSVFFPVGERFFIASVRHYRDQVTDPGLKAAVTAFIGQEAMHGREHEEYNALLAAAGLPVAAQEARIKKRLDWVMANLPTARQLGGTIALEHFTAFLADRLLADAEVLGGAEPHFAKLWRWHALEETEHKAVAFDVWRTVMGDDAQSYRPRAAALLTATVIFSAFIVRHYRENLAADPLAAQEPGGHLGGLARLFKVLVLRPGVLRKSVKPWADWFKPGFHPWDHQNAHFLQQLETFGDELAAAAAGAAVAGRATGPAKVGGGAANDGGKGAALAA